MSDFSENVYGAFRRLQDEHGFVAAREYASRRFVPLVRQLRDEAVLYLFVHDGRPGNSDVVVSIWVAPPHAPDDGLDKLMVGLKSIIASSFDIDDTFFALCQERVIAVLPHIAGMADFAETERVNPAFHTARYRAYCLERRAYETLCRIKKLEQSRYVLDLFNIVNEVRRGRASMSDLEASCIVAAKELLSERRFEQDVDQFYQGDPVFLATSLLGYIYIRAILDRLE